VMNLNICCLPTADYVPDIFTGPPYHIHVFTSVPVYRWTGYAVDYDYNPSRHAIKSHSRVSNWTICRYHQPCLHKNRAAKSALILETMAEVTPIANHLLHSCYITITSKIPFETISWLNELFPNYSGHVQRLMPKADRLIIIIKSSRLHHLLPLYKNMCSNVQAAIEEKKGKESLHSLSPVHLSLLIFRTLFADIHR
jgi:hypothetical protein